MKVFISWSGPASGAVAELLRIYLPCMLQDVRAFLSSHDLASGVRWSAQLSKELDEATFGIICLTPDNLHNDWILFEAGALTKHVDARACCLLLQNLAAADVPAPLAQFQNRAFEQSEFGKLLSDLNALLPSPLSEANLQMVVNNWWPELEAKVTAALEHLPGVAAQAKRDSRDVFEEILVRVRNMQARLDRPVPSLNIPAIDIANASTLLEQGAEGDEYFTVTFSPLRPSGQELLVRLDPYTTFQVFLDQMYKFVVGNVPPFSYGIFWAFRDAETGAVISHARTQAAGGAQPRTKDHRKLVEVGIRSGVRLEAIRLDESHTT